MDLLAVATQDHQIQVFRFNGQRAFELSRGLSSRKVQSMQWKFNGQALAVGWDDGTVEVISAESGKVLQHVKHVTTAGDTPSAGPSKSPVLAISWSNTFINPRPERGFNPPSARLTWPRPEDDLHSDSHSPSIPNLPTYLASLDAESLLPRLPPIPSTNASTGSTINPEVFAQQSSLGSLFQSANSSEPGSVDILTIHQRASNAARIVLADSLNLGDLPFPSSWTDNRFGPVSEMHYASHPSSHSRVLLPIFGQEDSPNSALVFAPLSFSFISPAGDRLSPVTAKTTQAQNLLHYIRRGVEVAVHAWAAGERIPSVLMEDAITALEAKKPETLVAAFHRLVMTGNCPSSLKGWLVEELGESGQKRWHAAIDPAYQKVLETFHQSIFPAVDRLSILVSALRGLATHFSDNPILQVPIADFNSVLDHARSLRLQIHFLLLVAAAEREQFNTFSQWLKREIGRQSSSIQKDDPEKEEETNYAKLFAYLNGPLTASRLSVLLAPMNEEEMKAVEPMSYEDLHSKLEAFVNIKKAPTGVSAMSLRPTSGRRLLTQKSSLKQRPKPVEKELSVWAQFKLLADSCRELTEKITRLQLQRTELPFALTLETKGKPVLVNSRMVEVPATGSDRKSEDRRLATYIAVVKENERNRVHFHRLQHKPLMSVKEDIEGCDVFYLELEDTEILDVKFVDDTEVLILIKQESSNESQPNQSSDQDDDPPGVTYSILSFPYAVEGLDLMIAHPPSILGQYYEPRVYPDAFKDIEFPTGEADVPFRLREEFVIPANEVKNYAKHVFGQRPRWVPRDGTGPGNGHEKDEESGIFEPDHFVPCRFDVNGGKDRRIICVIGEGGNEYKVLDLDRKQSEARHADVSASVATLDSIMAPKIAADRSAGAERRLQPEADMVMTG